MKTSALAQEGIAPIAHAIMASLFVVALYIYMTTGYASAGVPDAVGKVYQQACTIVPDLGTLAIIVIGIAAMFGRITWTQALVVAVGIAVASGAAGVYKDITGADGTACGVAAP